MEDLRYEVVRSHDAPDESEYRVEAIDNKSGECYVTIFSGPQAKDRAQEYAALKNVPVSTRGMFGSRGSVIESLRHAIMWGDKGAVAITVDEANHILTILEAGAELCAEKHEEIERSDDQLLKALVEAYANAGESFDE